MLREIRLVVALFVLTICLVAPVVAADGPAISSYLERALADDAYPHRDEAGRLAVWVYFRDKGLTGVELGAALNRAEDALSDRAARRRAKVKRIAGERLAGVIDLPLHRPYLDAVAATGAAPRRESRWLNAASFDATPEQIAAIAGLPQVARVDLVNMFRRDEVQVRPEDVAAREARNAELRAGKAAAWDVAYGGTLSELEQINVPPLHDEGVTGAGVLIGMLDTGFHTAHDCLAPITVVASWDFVNDDGEVDNEPGDPSNSNDHGTKTMSTIMGYEPGAHVGPAFSAQVVLAKTEDVSQEVPIEEDNWVAGIEWLETFGIDVATSSLGYIDWYDFADLDGNTAACTNAADTAVGLGIVVCNSAGNERGTSWNHIITPADGDSVITVGAVTSSGDLSYFSSPGPSYDGRIKPDVCALGSGNHVASSTDDQAYTSASGTSFSCPLTGGVAALVLSRVPSLTPMQVREAMRETASQAATPDNDYGWGILDAHAAAHYYGAAIAHAPLGDTEDTAGPYTVACTITDRVALDPATLKLWWNVDGGVWNETALTPVGGDDYEAAGPGQPGGSDVAYYLSAGDELGIVTTLPLDAPAGVFAFHVGPDLTDPVVSHQPLGDQPLLTWPATVVVTASDNLGIGAVTVSFEQNAVPQPDFALIHQGGDLFAADFPVPAGQVAIDDVFTYSVSVTDLAGVPNEVVLGPHAFTVIDALGVALLIDDAAAAKAEDPKYGPDKRALAPHAGANKGSPDDMARWLTDAGYVITEVDAAALQATDFDNMQFAILSCGDNTAPVEDANLRTLVQDWVAAGGKLLVEGGELGYDAESYPGYPDFAANVLHVSDWRTDSAGDLRVVSGLEGHPLLNLPHALPSSLAVSYSGYGDEDAMDPTPDAYVVLEPAAYAGAGGVIVFDDNPAPQAAQVVNFCFNAAALVDTTAARQLVENAAAFLMADEGAPTSSIAGMVDTSSGDVFFPIEGALVSAGPGLEAQSDPFGWYVLDDLYAGTYQLVVSKEGFATTVATVEVGEGEDVQQDFHLYPIMTVEYLQDTPVAIPDNTPAGITSVINVTDTGEIAGVTVPMDITHTWIGDLVVELTSPEGTSVSLHNRTGSMDDDILGTYGETLTVDGPGQLLDFLGENPLGDWTLTVSDHVGSDTGTLNSWGLTIVMPQTGTAVDEDTPRVTRLLGNSPNPFNPRTVIAFELARAGTPRLAIFDLRGREVRRLLDGQALPAGRHEATWDGRDAAGRVLASGLYLYRFTAGEIVEERKMLLTR
ncbi:S8 family serine peptidase [bacterium]|nr:S8 family serine peptidase [bacterium]